MIAVPRERWALRANQLLLQYIQGQAREGKHYCDDDTRAGLRQASYPAQLTHELIAPLVRWKNLWASDMAENDSGAGVDPAVQRDTWVEAMRQAEAEITELRQRHSQRKAA